MNIEMKNEYNSIPESFRKKHIDKIIKISNKEKRTNKSYLVTSPVKESQLNNIKIIHLKSASKNYSNRGTWSVSAAPAHSHRREAVLLLGMWEEL